MSYTDRKKNNTNTKQFFSISLIFAPVCPSPCYPGYPIPHSSGGCGLTYTNGVVSIFGGKVYSIT